MAALEQDGQQPAGQHDPVAAGPPAPPVDPYQQRSRDRRRDGDSDGAGHHPRGQPDDGGDSHPTHGHWGGGCAEADRAAPVQQQRETSSAVVST